MQLEISQEESYFSNKTKDLKLIEGMSWGLQRLNSKTCLNIL